MVPDLRSSRDFPKDHGKVGPLPFHQTSANLFAPLYTINLPSYLDYLLELKKSLKLRMEWFGKFTSPLAKESGPSIYHASFKTIENERRGINTIMPMINKEVNTLEKHYHVMNVNNILTAF